MPQDEELRAELRRLAGEVEHLRDELSGEVGRLAGTIGGLAAEVRTRVSPEDVAELARMASEMRAWMQGLLVPWRREIEQHFVEESLWTRRIESGEAELVGEVVGKYATYRSYHHIPSSQRFVKTTPRPYG